MVVIFIIQEFKICHFLNNDAKGLLNEGFHNELTYVNSDRFKKMIIKICFGILFGFYKFLLICFWFIQWFWRYFIFYIFLYVQSKIKISYLLTQCVLWTIHYLQIVLYVFCIPIIFCYCMRFCCGISLRSINFRMYPKKVIIRGKWNKYFCLISSLILLNTLGGALWNNS